MTSESPTQPAAAPTPPRAGWYRDPATGRRRLWNGSRWIDLADTITPFTVEADPEPKPSSPPPGEALTDRSTGIFVAVAGVLFLALFVLALVGIGSGSGPARPSVPSVAAGTRGASSSDTGAGHGAGSTGGATTSTSDAGPSASAALDAGSSGPGPVGSTGTGPMGSTGSGAGGTPTDATAPAGDTGSAGSTVPAVVPATGGRPVLTVVGDSITALSTKQLQRTLSHQFRTKIASYGGTTISNWLAFISSTVHSQSPHDWVVELGTNDVLQGTVTWQSDFLQEVLELSGQSCVVMVTVNPRLGPAAAELNQAMENVASTQPAFHVLDWGDDEFDQPGWLRSDGIHPTKAGSAELARLEHATLRSDC